VRLTIVLHAGASLGFKGPELLRSVAEGQLAIAEIPTGMVEGDAPVLALTAQPFISTNAFEQRLLYQLSKPVYAKHLETVQPDHPVYIGVAVFRYLHPAAHHL
jgi:TRAP-type transport system periplasmic protein